MSQLDRANRTLVTDEALRAKFGADPVGKRPWGRAASIPLGPVT